MSGGAALDAESLYAAGMPNIEAKLKSLGVELPAAPKPVAAYVPCKRVGNLVWVSGQIPMRDGVLMGKGSVPTQVSSEEAKACARQCAINALAQLKAELGTLDAIRQVVRVGVWVCCEAGFVDQPKIANGASEFLVEVFGEGGKHARAAVGSIALPLGACVEVEVLVEVG